MTTLPINQANTELDMVLENVVIQKIPAHTHQASKTSSDVLITPPTVDGCNTNELQMLLEDFESQLHPETFLQPTEVSSDVQPTQKRDNTYNNSIKVENDILPITIPSNLSMSEFFPIYEDLSDPTPQPTVMLSDNTHESEAVATTSTHNNGKPSAYQLHNIIVETENKQKFVTTNNDENSEWDVATCSRDWVETTPHKKNLKLTMLPPSINQNQPRNQNQKRNQNQQRNQ